MLCLWHVRKAWAENVVKKIPDPDLHVEVLKGLASLMYSSKGRTLWSMQNRSLRILNSNSLKQYSSSITSANNGLRKPKCGLQGFRTYPMLARILMQP
jgi:hypothetical protein